MKEIGVFVAGTVFGGAIVWYTSKHLWRHLEEYSKEIDNITERINRARKSLSIVLERLENIEELSKRTVEISEQISNVEKTLEEIRTEVGELIEIIRRKIKWNITVEVKK